MSDIEMPEGDIAIWGAPDTEDFNKIVRRLYTAEQMAEYSEACALAERERCAKLCEQMGDAPDGSSEGYERACAIVIRAQTYPTKEQQVG
jgi:NADH pyrophosphatase NudC (nudix superfamily)